MVPGLLQAEITGLKTRGTSTDQSGPVAHQKRVPRSGTIRMVGNLRPIPRIHDPTIRVVRLRRTRSWWATNGPGFTGLKTRGTSSGPSCVVAHQKRVMRRLLDLCWRSGLSMAICGMEGDWL
jgi:hypothetical protein